MNIELIQLIDKVLNSKGQSLSKSNEYMWWSPFVTHHKPKLQVNIQTGKWHCWVSNQGGHNLFQLLKKVGASRQEFQSLSKILGETTFYKSSKDSADNLDIKLPDEFKSLAEPHISIIRDHAMLFLKKKGITEEDIKRYNLGYCSEGQYQNRIIIPSYDEHGRLNYFVGRDFYASTLKYKNPPIPKDVIGFDLYINWSLPIILVEGVFDAMSVKSNSIPLFGKSILPKLYGKIVEKKVKEILIPDVKNLDDEKLAMYCKKFVKTNYHPSGTAKMGADGDKMAVLDAKMRVRGIENLRVCDLSAVPNINFLYNRKG